MTLLCLLGGFLYIIFYIWLSVKSESLINYLLLYFLFCLFLFLSFNQNSYFALSIPLFTINTIQFFFLISSAL